MKKDSELHISEENAYKLAEIYKQLRIVNNDFQLVLDHIVKTGEGIFFERENDNKQLDKSIMLSMVGYKFLKKVLKRHGYKGLKKKAMQSNKWVHKIQL